MLQFKIKIFNKVVCFISILQYIAVPKKIHKINSISRINTTISGSFGNRVRIVFYTMSIDSSDIHSSDYLDGIYDRVMYSYVVKDDGHVIHGLHNEDAVVQSKDVTVHSDSGVAF